MIILSWYNEWSTELIYKLTFYNLKEELARVLQVVGIYQVIDLKPVRGSVLFYLIRN